MTGRAEIRLAGRDGMFVADVCTIDRPFITATGCWRRRLATRDTFGELRTYTWPASEIREVRWSTERATS